MLLYVTPAKARLMGLGIGSDVTDVDLRAALVRASRRVNAICAVANRPQQHDFRGGSITDEEHPWHLPKNEVDTSQRRIYMWHWPIQDVSSLRLDVTNQQYVAFQPSEIMVTDRYLEIISLAMTVTGLFGGGVLPVIGLSVPIMRSTYTYGERFEVTDEELVVDDEDSLRWRAENQWWTSEDDVVVRVDGTVVVPEKIDLEEGTVTFAAPPVGDVTADYVHRLDSDIAQATGLLAGQALDQADLRKKGLGGLQRVRVGEIELEKARMIGSGSAPGQGDPSAAPREVLELLEGRRAVWAGA